MKNSNQSRDYNKFFQQLRNNDLDGFSSDLDVVLRKVVPANSLKTA